MFADPTRRGVRASAQVSFERLDFEETGGAPEKPAEAGCAVVVHFDRVGIGIPYEKQPAVVIRAVRLGFVRHPGMEDDALARLQGNWNSVALIHVEFDFTTFLLALDGELVTNIDLACFVSVG